jgi:hypothetical protein
VFVGLCVILLPLLSLSLFLLSLSLFYFCYSTSCPTLSLFTSCPSVLSPTVPHCCSGYSMILLSHRSFLLLPLSLFYFCYSTSCPTLSLFTSCPTVLSFCYLFRCYIPVTPLGFTLCSWGCVLGYSHCLLCSWSCVRGLVFVGLLVFTLCSWGCWFPLVISFAVLLSLFYSVFVVLFFSACFVSFSFFSLPFFLISFAVLLCVRGVVGSPLFSLTLFYLLYMVTRYMCAVLVVMPVFTLMLHHLCFLLRTQRTPLLFTLVLLLVFHLLIIGILLL